MKQIQCAEATITEKNGNIIKDRIEKPYRIKLIDDKLRKSRTNREAKVLKKLENSKVNVPKLIRKENFTITMEKINGEKVRDILNKDNLKDICKKIANSIENLHNEGIIHGDLTTSNMIINKNLYLIDFGLSFFSVKIEDKAVDLHLLEEAINSKHYEIAKEANKIILSNYKNKEVKEKLKKVKDRGRNKSKA